MPRTAFAVIISAMFEQKRRSPTVYVLGAGASVSAGAPLTEHFLPDLYRGGPADDGRLGRLRRFIEDVFDVDPSRPDTFPKYEIVLSLIELALQRGKSLSRDYPPRELALIRHDLIYLIWRSLGLTEGGGESPLHDRFVSILEPGDVVISLNYDLFLDHAILRRYGTVEYGWCFDAVVSREETGRKGPMRPAREDRPRRTGRRKGGDIPMLLKIHGSINWLLCPTCNRTYLYLGRDAVAGIFSPKGEYCPHDGTYLAGILIPPTYLKEYRNHMLDMVWLEAEAALRCAQRVVFIGYSLPEADMNVLFMLKRGLLNNHNDQVDLVVVNPEKRRHLKDRYRSLLGPLCYRTCTFERWLGEDGRRES